MNILIIGQSYFKKTLIVLALFLSISNTSSAQNFYKNYKSYLFKNAAKVSPARKKIIDSLIKRFQSVTDNYAKENERSFFVNDTVYLVNFIEAETNFTSGIIWNKYASCYYHYTFNMVKRKIVSQKLEKETNASSILKSFNKDFRLSIETGDTSAYNKFANAHKVFDGDWVSPIMAIKNKEQWVFIPFKGNGWAIDFDFQPAK